MRKVLILAVASLLYQGLVFGQTEIIDFLDPEMANNPEDLIDALMLEKDSSWNGFKRRIRMQSILNSGFKTGQEIQNYRARFLLQTSSCDLSFLGQPDHLTAGILLEPVKERLKMVIGDYQFDHGLGMLFTTKRTFHSWSQNPHSFLHRARGLTVNTSSDSSRFLRGGGISFSKKGVEVSGLFSYKSSGKEFENVEGLFLNFKRNKFQSGAGVVSFQDLTEKYVRYGGYLKYGLSGAIAFIEFAAVNTGGQALEAGLSFFGLEQHRFIFLYRMGTPAYYQKFTKMALSQDLFVDEKKLEFNYVWEWRNGWFFQTDLLSKESFALEDKGLAPKSKWMIRSGIKRDRRDGVSLNFNLGLDPDGLKGMLRYRFILNKQGNFVQPEFGYSLKIDKIESKKYNSYLGIDWAFFEHDGRLTLKGGACIHRAQSGGILLYRYEPDLYYQMSLPVISGSGFRAYLSCKYKINNGLQLELKLNRSIYFDKEESVKNQLKIQIVWRPVWVAESF